MDVVDAGSHSEPGVHYGRRVFPILLIRRVLPTVLIRRVLPTALIRRVLPTLIRRVLPTVLVVYEEQSCANTCR